MYQPTSKYFAHAQKYLPTEEHSGFLHLFDHIMRLAQLALQFEAAVALFDFSQDDRLPSRRDEESDEVYFTRRHDMQIKRAWIFIAARDAAITLDQFFKSLKGIGNYRTKCPTFYQRLDLGKIREVRRDFTKVFPHIEKIRNRVAHEVENLADPAKMEKHADGKLYMINSMIGRQFVNTIDRERVGYELSDAATNEIKETVAAIVSLFDEACASLLTEKERNFWGSVILP